VDANGGTRIILGAPLPSPVVNGKTQERRSPATGIIFKDSGGNERGGVGMLDDGSMNLCFDDAKSERDCMFFVPKMGNGVALNDASGNTRAVLYVDPSGAPHLLLNDAEGHSLVSLPDATKQPKPQE
jgi:hypothetical protein